MGKVTIVGGKVGMTKPNLLPANLTELYYIQSTGKQCINTGLVAADVDTRIEIEACFTPTSSSQRMGAYNGIYFGISNNNMYTYGPGYQTEIAPSTNNFDVISFSKSVSESNYDYSLTVNGVTQTSSSTSTNSSTYYLYLFACDLGSNPTYYCTCKLKKAKIYQSDTLVRNFIPCMNEDGKVGMYDTVSKTFFGSISGSFIGMDMNGNEIVGSVKANELAVGTEVYIMENESPVAYVVINQGVPSNSSLYDSSCNGTWLLRKYVYQSMVFDGTDNDYKNSNVHQYLNNDFLSLFDATTQNAIKQVKIPYMDGNGSVGLVASGANGLSTKIFLLSALELGKKSGNQVPVDGAIIEYFGPSPSDSNNRRRIVYKSASDQSLSYTYWFSRSPRDAYSEYVWSVNNYNGSLTYSTVTGSNIIRPALILNSMAEFDEDTLVLKG